MGGGQLLGRKKLLPLVSYFVALLPLGFIFLFLFLSQVYWAWEKKIKFPKNPGSEYFDGIGIWGLLEILKKK